MQVNSLLGPLEGVGLEISTFWTMKWQRVKPVPFGQIKIKVHAPYKKTGTLVILYTCAWLIFCILYSVLYVVSFMYM
jgi:hypothetical protein